MSIDARRVRAIVRKDITEYRRSKSIVSTMLVLPIIFLIQPVASVLTLPTTQSAAMRHEQPLLYLLAIPALVPALLAAYAVVGERQQGTLEPVLTTPIKREEFLLGKALSALIPSVVVAYVVYGIFLAVVEIFAQPGVATALIHWPELVAQLLFTPLLAAWSIWLGITISTRASEVRVAQQLGMLANLPSVAVTTLIAFRVIPQTRIVAVAGAALLVALIRIGWRVASAAFDRERLITGIR
jgi:ABC-type transport system involved in multi-copper enzyme maturation permease subunit